jgi:hypothetical protein
MKQDEVDLPEIELGTYRHSKTGHLYEVIGVALSTEESQAMVVYKPLWESKYGLFVRPYEMFTQTVEIDGIHIPRFEKVVD